MKQRLQTEVYEGITERVFGRTFSLHANPEYRNFFARHGSFWTPDFQTPPQDQRLSNQQPSQHPQTQALTSPSASLVNLEEGSTLDAGIPSPRTVEDVGEDVMHTQPLTPNSALANPLDAQHSCISYLDSLTSPNVLDTSSQPIEQQRPRRRSTRRSSSFTQD